MGQIITVPLPDIGEGVAEGEVIEWLKPEGSLVLQDEPIVVVMTDKATVELPAPYPGKLVKHYFRPGQMAPKGKPLYDLEVEGVQAPVTKKIETSLPKAELKIEPSFGGQVLAIPAVRKLARDLHVNIDLVQGTGPGGRVTESDVVRYHAELQPHKRPPMPVTADDKAEPMVGLRRITAEKMTESMQVIPQYSFFDRADATLLIKMREKFKEKGSHEGIAVTFMPFFIRALSLTIKRYPICNASVDPQNQQIIYHKKQHIGIATKMEEGLAVCVLKDVQEMDLERIIRAYDALMTKAKEKKLERADMVGSTCTISNFGPLGGEWATPIINPPETAILGLAKIEPQPVVRNHELTIRSMINLSWSFDHRAIDGEGAASISNMLIELIENPAKLI